MTVWIVLLQPDGDWDHVAELRGVFSSGDAAHEFKNTQDARNPSRPLHVITAELDQPIGRT